MSWWAKLGKAGDEYHRAFLHRNCCHNEWYQGFRECFRRSLNSILYQRFHIYYNTFIETQLYYITSNICIGEKCAGGQWSSPLRDLLWIPFFYYWNLFDTSLKMTSRSKMLLNQRFLCSLKIMVFISNF